MKLQLNMRRNAPGIQDGTGCGPRMVQSGQSYTLADCLHVEDWLAERDAGYPKRDLPWPTEGRNERAAAWLGYLFNASTWDLIYGNGVRRRPRSVFSLHKI